MKENVNTNDSGIINSSRYWKQNGADVPKQFMHVDNKPLIIHTMEAFQNHPSIYAILVVTLRYIRIQLIERDQEAQQRRFYSG